MEYLLGILLGILWNTARDLFWGNNCFGQKCIKTDAVSSVKTNLEATEISNTKVWTNKLRYLYSGGNIMQSLKISGDGYS